VADEFKSKFETCQKEIPEKKPGTAKVGLYFPFLHDLDRKGSVFYEFSLSRPVES